MAAFYCMSGVPLRKCFSFTSMHLGVYRLPLPVVRRLWGFAAINGARFSVIHCLLSRCAARGPWFLWRQLRCSGT